MKETIRDNDPYELIEPSLNRRDVGEFYYGHQDEFRERGLSYRPAAGTDLTPLRRKIPWSVKDWDDFVAVYARKITGTLPGPKPPSLNYQFKPAVKNPENFRFNLFGDTGQNTPTQYLVTATISDFQTYPTDFTFLLGDIIYPAGDADDYEYGFFEAFRHYPRPIYAVPGNHDWYDSLKGYEQFFITGRTKKTFPRYGRKCPHLPNWFYFMDFPGLRIICLDTGVSGKMEENKATQLLWLDWLLESAEEQKIIVFMHHPPYSLCERGFDVELRRIVEPRFEKHKVAAVFSGHDHNYQHHIVHNTHYVICGAGGATLTELPTTRRVETFSVQKPNITLRLPLNRCWDRVHSFLYCHYDHGTLRVECWSADPPEKRFLLDAFSI